MAETRQAENQTDDQRPLKERRVSISFDRAAAFYDETRGGEQRGRLCAQAIEPRFASSGLTLEIGVGTGLVGAALQAGGRRVAGVDISVQMLQRARSRKLAVAHADALALPFASGSVDDAYSVWLLHLVADQAAVLREVMRVLRPGGGRALLREGLPLDRRPNAATRPSKRRPRSQTRMAVRGRPRGPPRACDSGRAAASGPRYRLPPHGARRPAALPLQVPCRLQSQA